MNIRVFERKRPTGECKCNAESVKTVDTNVTANAEPKVTMSKSMYDKLIKENAEAKMMLADVAQKSAERVKALEELEKAVKQKEMSFEQRIKELSEEIVKWKNAYHDVVEHKTCKCQEKSNANAVQPVPNQTMIQQFIDEFEHNHPDYEVKFTADGDVTTKDLMEYFAKADEMANDMEKYKKCDSVKIHRMTDDEAEAMIEDIFNQIADVFKINK